MTTWGFLCLTVTLHRHMPIYTRFLGRHGARPHPARQAIDSLPRTAVSDRHLRSRRPPRPHRTQRPQAPPPQRQAHATTPPRPEGKTRIRQRQSVTPVTATTVPFRISPIKLGSRQLWPDHNSDVPDRTPFWRSFTIFACFSGFSVTGAAGIAAGSLDGRFVKKACFTGQGGIDATDS